MLPPRRKPTVPRRPVKGHIAAVPLVPEGISEQARGNAYGRPLQSAHVERRWLVARPFVKPRILHNVKNVVASGRWKQRLRGRCRNHIMITRRQQGLRMDCR